MEPYMPTVPQDFDGWGPGGSPGALGFLPIDFRLALRSRNGVPSKSDMPMQKPKALKSCEETAKPSGHRQKQQVDWKRP